MRFGDVLRGRRIAAGMTSAEKLSERCGQAIARGDVRDAAVPSAAHIKSIEIGARNPKAADVAMWRPLFTRTTTTPGASS